MESRIFKDYKHISARELFKPGQCTVLQLNEIDPREQQVIVSVLLRRLYRARMETERGKAGAGEEHFLPYPAFVLLEEAHHFAPGGEGTGPGGVRPPAEDDAVRGAKIRHRGGADQPSGPASWTRTSSASA